MFITFHTGAFNDVAVTAMLSDGLNGGDYTAAAGFAAGFLVARILEGPLVGLLDIGGSLMTGVGIGIPALLLSTGVTFPLSNFFVALICGALVGAVLGLVIMLIRKLVPGGVAVGGTDIMMGAGNRTGRFLGPLVIIAACVYNPWVGIGAILGAMILGAIFL